MEFRQTLKSQLLKESKNFYLDNYDYFSRGPQKSVLKKVINVGKWIFFREEIFRLFFWNSFLYDTLFLRLLYKMDKKYLSYLEYFYKVLEDAESKGLLVKLVAFKILGYVKVKLPFNSPQYWQTVSKVDSIKDETNPIMLGFSPWKLFCYDLSEFGYNFKLYFSTNGIYSTFIAHHYHHLIHNVGYIGASPGDVVLDLGGCYGDTALYFAMKVGQNGKVYSFEFIPKSLEIFNLNLNLNTHLKNRITIIESPLWSESGRTIFYKDNGGGSQVSFKDFNGREGIAVTITLDEFILKNRIEKIDFIKSDIEGAESFVLKGATKLLKKFKPKLAISIYHSKSDFVNIVRQISDLNLGYKFYLGHASMYSSETVLFCISSES
jgi:FkbM family methyltransferase